MAQGVASTSLLVAVIEIKGRRGERKEEQGCRGQFAFYHASSLPSFQSLLKVHLYEIVAILSSALAHTQPKLLLPHSPK